MTKRSGPAAAFVAALKERGLTFVSGVPDSTLRSVFEQVLHDPEIRYVPAVREDVALGVASAAYFTGRLGLVLLQNSGLGNLGSGRRHLRVFYPGSSWVDLAGDLPAVAVPRLRL